MTKKCVFAIFLHKIKLKTKNSILLKFAIKEGFTDSFLFQKRMLLYTSQ